MLKRKSKAKPATSSDLAELPTARLALLGLLRSARLLAQEVQRLEAENAMLREQLRRAKC